MDGCEVLGDVDPQVPREQVSILTRRRGRVRGQAFPAVETMFVFQSSPVAVDGCEQRPDRERREPQRVSILTRRRGRVRGHLWWGNTASCPSMATPLSPLWLPGRSPGPYVTPRRLRRRRCKRRSTLRPAGTGGPRITAQAGRGCRSQAAGRRRERIGREARAGGRSAGCPRRSRSRGRAGRS